MTDLQTLETQRDALIEQRAQLDQASKQLQAQLTDIDDERDRIHAAAVDRLIDASLENRTADLVDLTYRVAVLDLTTPAIPKAIERLQQKSQRLALELRNLQLDLQDIAKAERQKSLQTIARQIHTQHGSLNRTTFISRVREAMREPGLSEKAICDAMGWR